MPPREVKKGSKRARQYVAVSAQVPTGKSQLQKAIAGKKS